jgi:hypothetical protein
LVVPVTATFVHALLPTNAVVCPEKKSLPEIVRVPPDTGIVEEGLIELTKGDLYENRADAVVL